MVELLQGFNNMKTYSKGVHGRQCVHVVMMFVLVPLMGNAWKIKWSSNLCHVVDYKWHHPACLKGYCVGYGINMLITHPCEEDKRS